MKTSANLPLYRRYSLKAAAFLAALLIQQGAPAYGQYVWTATAAGIQQWSTASNWSGGLPSNPATGSVSFNNNTSGRSFTVQLSTDQTLGGGLTLQSNTSTSGNLTFDLNSHKMVISGSSVLINPSSTLNGESRTLYTFTNGTFQLGTSSNSSALLIGGGSVAGSMTHAATTKFTSTSTFDTANTSSIEIASLAINQPHNLILDLSEATLVSGGTSGVLKVSDSILIGRALTTTPSASRGKTGELKLGVVSKIEIGNDLVLGQNARTSNADATGIGSVTFSTAPAQGSVDLTIGRDLKMGIGVGAEGRFNATPALLNLTISSEATRGGVVQVGYRNLNYTGDVLGHLQATGGSLNGHITELRVGQNTVATGAVTGTFDFRNSTLGTLDISGDAVIGKGVDAVGDVRLKSGNASSLNLSVGESTAATRSLLSLNATLWTVEDSLRVGGKGDIAITLGIGSFGGIDLLSDDASDFSIVGDGAITITFDSSEGESSIWGIRMKGDHVALFNSYLDEDQLVGIGAFGESAYVFKDATYTYYGFAPIPEPSTFGLVFLSGAAFTVARHRSRKQS